MHRRLRHLIALFALAFFFTPLLLLAGGVRATEFENRRLAEPPKLSEGWDVFDSMTRYVIDHMPLRERAVRANAWKSLNVFRTTPTYTKRVTNAMEPAAGAGAADAAPDTASQVLVGVDDWYYLQGDTDRACSPFMDWDDAVARWERLGALVRRSGRKVVVAIAPDKSTIYPEHLPSPFTNEDCAAKGRDTLWSTLEAAREPSLLPLRAPLVAAKGEFDMPVFFRTDSHWNSAGSAVFVREVIDRVGSAPLPESAIVVTGEAPMTGDLGNLLGTPIEETAISVEVRATRKLLPGRVAFVHDSFGMGPLGPMQAQAGSLTTALWAGDTPARIAEVIAANDTIVLETVEREVTFRADAVLTDEFFTLLERELSARR